MDSSWSPVEKGAKNDYCYSLEIISIVFLSIYQKLWQLAKFTCFVLIIYAVLLLKEDIAGYFIIFVSFRLPLSDDDLNKTGELFYIINMH